MANYHDNNRVKSIRFLLTARANKNQLNEEEIPILLHLMSDIGTVQNAYSDSSI